MSALEEAINTVCRDLPEGFEIQIRMEKDAGWVELVTSDPRDDAIQIEGDGTSIAEDLIWALETAVLKSPTLQN